MNEMYFKSILIADLQTYTARFQEFSKGLNVITSTDNHVGKSSLLKSLYYTLGAEVDYDFVWDKQSKLYCVDICIDEEDYRVIRFMKRFALFHKDKLILLTDSVMRELTPALEKIFNFSVYLPNKETKKVEMAPPAFTFMPYYIDQDKGWSGLYESFSHIDQYKKDDRIRSLYYHLGIYTKSTVELMTRRDLLKDQLDQLETDGERIGVILEALAGEVQNLVPADTIEELENNLQIPKRKIEVLVQELGVARNEIQQLETSLHEHQHQLLVVQEYHTIKGGLTPDKKSLQACPNCGYLFDEEIFNLVRTNYNVLNEDYMCQQMKLIIDSISKDLKCVQERYVAIMAKLREEEQAFKNEQNEFDLYVRQRGLNDSIKRFNIQLRENKAERIDVIEEMKEIAAELRKLPNKKEVEEKYIELVRLNIMKLDAWNPSYDGNIKLLKPIKAQGTLENKIILAQFIGLFQTMEYFHSNTIRFAFVVDSPRAKEASVMSSKDILKMIAEIDMLPQIILATMDYGDFQSEIGIPTTFIELTEKRKLLCNRDYESNKTYIDEMAELMKQV